MMVLKVLLLFVVALGFFVNTIVGLQCFKCGQYNDGVGSITPCINYTHMQVIECPSLEHRYCIKYISEGSTVRDCVGDCIQKESWSTRTYCCKEDACNSSTEKKSTFHLVLATSVMLIALIRTR